MCRELVGRIPAKSNERSLASAKEKSAVGQKIESSAEFLRYWLLNALIIK
jgi:hypothetical protein